LPHHKCLYLSDLSDIYLRIGHFLSVDYQQFSMPIFLNFAILIFNLTYVDLYLISSMVLRPKISSKIRTLRNYNK